MRAFSQAIAANHCYNRQLVSLRRMLWYKDRSRRHTGAADRPFLGQSGSCDTLWSTEGR